jgi:hypothetical protein
MTYSMTPQDQMSAHLPSYTSVVSTCRQTTRCLLGCCPQLGTAHQNVHRVSNECHAAQPLITIMSHRTVSCVINKDYELDSYRCCCESRLWISADAKCKYLGRHVLGGPAGGLAQRAGHLVLRVPEVAHFDDGQRLAAVQEHVVQLHMQTFGQLVLGVMHLCRSCCHSLLLPCWTDVSSP